MIKRLLFITTLFIVAGHSIFAQVQLKFDLPSYESDTLLLAYYYGDKILVLDSLYGSDGQFEYAQDTTLGEGMYVIVEQGSGDYHQFLMDNEDQEFEMTVDDEADPKIKFRGSKENKLFYSYINWLQKQREKGNRINDQINGLDTTSTSRLKALHKERDDITNQVREYQAKLIGDHPTSITAMMIRANLHFDFPEFTGTAEEIETQKYHYYKEHYFDNVLLGRPAMLRTPIIDKRVDYYLSKLTPQSPDSIIQSVDRILALMEPAEETYSYYVSTFLSKYGNSKYVGMDAVYVHLAQQYYDDQEKTPWVADKNRREIVSQARKIAPTLIGRTAPDFTLKTQDSSDISLSDFDTDYIVLVFWKPDCGHCTKAMPYIIDFNKKYKEQSVSLLTICTKTGKEFGECWEGVKEKNMGTLLNAGDEFHRSRIFSKYNITTTPLIYILDKSRAIRLKKVPAEKLDAIMDEIIKMDSE